MTEARNVSILGGGIAGLTAGREVAGLGYPVTVYEATPQIGGNCRTIEHNGFRFDTGAHRFHAQNDVATMSVKQLIQDDLQQIHAPSQIFSNGRFIDFPLSPIDVARNLGVRNSVKAGIDLVKGRLRQGEDDESFEDFALRTYGRTIAERLLLSYSEKLWGRPCSELSPSISGKRMKGLTFSALIREAVGGKRKKTTHLDGSFYYPRNGIGSICDILAAEIGIEKIRTSVAVRRVVHADNRITAVETEGGVTDTTSFAVSSLPLDLLIRSMSPAPPPDILACAEELRFRGLILVAVLLDQQQASPNASAYFPDPSIPFTRIYEPRNRSRHMSPEGKTSLVTEIPCTCGDELWNADDSDLGELIIDHQRQLRWYDAGKVRECVVYRMQHAYPVLTLKATEKVRRIISWLADFHNLFLTGRGGRFEYLHMHDMFVLASTAARACASSLK